ncbi:sigma-70 family RNA polymerase sigma factor [Pseudoneobacillus sp. C159]
MGYQADYRFSKEMDVLAMEPARALEWMMDEYGEGVKRFIFTYTKNATLAEDLTQEVFVNVYLKIDTFSGKSSLRTWIYSIAVNKCKDYFKSWHYRKIRLMGSFLETNMITLRSPEKMVAMEEDRVELIEQILALPLKYREVLLLFYYKEFSIEEIGELLGIGEATVKTRLRRARQKLKTVLDHENGGTV